MYCIMELVVIVLIYGCDEYFLKDIFLGLFLNFLVPFLDWELEFVDFFLNFGDMLDPIFLSS